MDLRPNKVLTLSGKGLVAKIPHITVPDSPRVATKSNLIGQVPTRNIFEADVLAFADHEAPAHLLAIGPTCNEDKNTLTRIIEVAKGYQPTHFLGDTGAECYVARECESAENLAQGRKLK